MKDLLRHTTLIEQLGSLRREHVGIVYISAVSKDYNIGLYYYSCMYSHVC